jgi:anaerobic magnesium-protoporphyrin IX monomethyl ester cyclase
LTTIKSNLHITLIRPPMITSKNNILFTKGIPPLGLAYIAGALEKDEIEYSLIDGIGTKINSTYHVYDKNLILRGMTFTEIIDMIPSHTTYIALSLMFTNEWVLHKILIQKIKKKFPHKIIIVGGEHATSSWKEILTQTPEVDFCVLGEGEKTFIELLKVLDSDNKITLPGVAHREQGVPKRTSNRERIRDINSLSCSWEKIPVTSYLAEGSGMNIINRRSMPILASRGCPYKCTFCSSPQMWGTQYYTRSPVEIIAEMQSLIQKYKVEHFDFTDLSTTVNREWTQIFCDEFISKKLNVTWQFGPGTRSEVLTPDLIERLKQANIYRLTLSPESGSSKTVKRIKKNINLTALFNKAKLAKKQGIIIKLQFIMGLPGQTFFEMLASASYILKLAWAKIDDISIFLYYPYPGSELAEQLHQKNIVFSDEEYSQMELSRIGATGGIPNKQILEHNKIILTLFSFGLMILCQILTYLRSPARIFESIYLILIKKPKRTGEMYILTKLQSFSKPGHIQIKSNQL